MPPILQAAAAAAAVKEVKQEVAIIDASAMAKAPKVPKMGTIVFPERPATPILAPESPPVSISRSAGGKRSLVIITGESG